MTRTVLGAVREVLKPQRQQFGHAQARSIGEVQHGSIAQASYGVRIGGVEQRLHLVAAEIVNQPRVGPLDRQCPDAHRLLKAGRRPVLDVAEEAPDGREADVAGARAVAAVALQMVEEGADEPHVEILDLKIGRLPLHPGGGEAQEQDEAVRVGCDRMWARAALARQVVPQEGGEMGRERRHSAPPANACSAAAAMPFSRIGVASRYQ
jgi:hypothetical protein